MKKTMLIISVALIAACTLAYLSKTKTEKSTVVETAAAEFPIEATVTPPPPTPVDARTAVGPHAVRRAADLLRANAYPAGLASDHEDMLMRSAAACTEATPEAQLKMRQQAESLVPSERQSMMLWLSFVSRYCEGFSLERAKSLLDGTLLKRSPSPDELAVNAAAEALVKQGHLRSFTAEQAASLSDALASTKSPRVFERAAYFLLLSPHAPDAYFADLDADTRGRSRNNQALLDQAAIQARCAMFGGCGPNGLLAMQGCFPRNCRYDSRYGDNSLAQLSNGEREIAKMIANRMIGARAPLN
jgi:hypothetical protein